MNERVENIESTLAAAATSWSPWRSVTSTLHRRPNI